MHPQNQLIMLKILTPLLFLITISQTVYSQKYAKNTLIAKYKKGARENSKASKILSENNLLETKKLTSFSSKNKDVSNIILFTFHQEIDVEKVITQLQQTNLFEYVEPNFIGQGAGQKAATTLTSTPNDTFFSRQWAVNNNGSFSLSPATENADVKLDEAWSISTGNENITIAILDSGVRMSHPEFDGRIWVNTSETNNGVDSDNNSYIDDINGWDFVNNDNNPTDDHGHGTNIAGIIGANGNNNIGYAGVDWKCKLMPIKILDENNFGQYSWWIEAINYAVNNGAKIINMSVGGRDFSQAMKDAIDNAHANGVLVIASMMNFNNSTNYYPASFDTTIAVGSTNPNDERSVPFFWNNTSGSNYGSHIDVVAPGNYIYGLSHTSDTNFDSYWGGTSQSAPLVSGICSLILSQDPNLSVEEVRNILRDTAQDQVGKPSEDTSGWDVYHGAGRVNARAALQRVLSTDSYTLSNLNIYPNPTDGVLNFPQEINENNFSIFNILGKEVLKGKIKNNSLDISFLNSGMYLLKVKNEKGTLIRKIVKK